MEQHQLSLVVLSSSGNFGESPRGSHCVSLGALLSSCSTSLFLALRSIWMNLWNCQVVATFEVSVWILCLSKAFRKALS